MAVVAVLDTHSETKPVAIPNAASSRFGLVPTARMIPNAMRRFSPCCNIASAIRKLPRKRKTIGSAKPRKISLAEPIPSNTHSAGPSSAVTASGIDSVIQSTTTAPSTANNRCASTPRPATGSAQKTTKTTGAATNPMVRRQ